MNLEFHLVNLALLTGLGIIGYFLKDMRSSIKERFEKSEKRIDCLEEKVHDLKEELPQRFVMREDYLRGMSMVISKLDRLFSEVSEIKERIAGGGK